MVTEQQILEQIKPILDLRMVTAIKINGAEVSFVIEIDPAQGKEMEPCRAAAQKAVEKIPGIAKVQAILTAEKKTEKKAPPQNLGTHKVSARAVAPDVKYIIAVASGKGGVGKSTVAANLAVSFALMGKKTGLLDADIYGASQPMMMGLRQKPDTDDQDMIVPPVRHGLKIMSMGFFVDPESPVIWRGPMVHSAIQQLLRDVAWGELDVLVIDLPPGTGDAQLSLAQHVPLAGAVIVSTPQDVALSEAVKGLRMFEKTSVPVLGIVENMSYHACPSCGHRDDVFGHGGAKNKAAELNVEFLGEIPLLTAIREKSDSGAPIAAAESLHPAADAFKNIAARLWIKLPETKKGAACWK